MRGERAWDQFLNYCHTVAQHRGGRLYAVQLTDPRYFPFIEQKLAEAKKQRKASRPGLEGDTAEVEWLRTIANLLRMLAGIPSQFEGPEGPSDLIEARLLAASNALLDEALGH